MTLDEFDEARLEWEFEKLAKDHALCCSGAILLHPADGGNPRWLNVLGCPADTPTYRSFPATSGTRSS